MTDLTTAELAKRLGVTRRRALHLLSDGHISARRLANGHWLANSDSVVRFELITKSGRGRTLSSDAAWGLLWELSGLKVNWLSPSTHARVRRRIRDSTVKQIASVVAGRTTENRFTAANVELANSDLIQSGRAAASMLTDLGVDLITDQRRVSGYVRAGSVSEFAASHFMLDSQTGNDVIYQATLPIEFQENVMPNAVIAADLARSTNARERAAGLLALKELREQWLAKH